MNWSGVEDSQVDLRALKKVTKRIREMGRSVSYIEAHALALLPAVYGGAASWSSSW